MKNVFRYLLVITLCSLTLPACQKDNSIPKSIATPTESTAAQTSTTTIEELDQQVVFTPNTQLLKMSSQEKKRLYQELDKIVLSTEKEEIVPLDYSNILPITSQEHIEKIINQSNSEIQLVYLGFDDCPYCKAFLPKLNQLASELNLKYYYYNTDERVSDENFRQLVDEYFKVSTVPQLFIIKDEKVYNHLGNYNKMEELENFLRQVSK